MLRTDSPNISIITNWGCHEKCWYCVWKKHPLKKVCLKTDWERLCAFLVFYKDKGKVSVSGGGDCLYNFGKHKKWWDKLFRTTKDLGMLVDVHSRTKFYNESFWRKVNRAVISSDSTDDIVDYIQYLFPLTKIRIVKVITHETRLVDVENYIKLSEDFECQLTFKEIFGYDDLDKYKIFKRIFPKQYFLDSGDYNIYFFPNNTVGDDFLNPLKET